MASLTGKVILITGGTSGIGHATALLAGKHGAKVVVSGRREKEGNEVVAGVKAAGGQASFFRADVSKEADVKSLIDFTLKTYGRIDGAFNNAGIEATGPMVEATEADYRKVFDINVLGVMLSMKHEIPAMLAGGGGSIVNTASVAGRVGMAGAGVYVASKHAVLGLTKCAAMEVAKQKIRINAVSPAAIETEMFERFTGGNNDAKSYMSTLHPIGRVGTSAEVAAAVLFLLSDDASFITGTDLLVDGGFTVP
jgi:NAD(P)-dependent dehydrogenase (short-subunit alcohol dehydrogenase family)